MRAIDTHVHFLDPERFRYPWMEHEHHAPLRRGYLPSDLDDDAASSAIELVGAVHVQAEVDHAIDPVLETAWIAELGEGPERSAPKACVPYADLLAPDLEQVLDRHLEYEIVRGIRQEAWFVPNSDRAEYLPFDILARPAFGRGLRKVADRGLLFELLIWSHQLESATALFGTLPDAPVVLEHTGLPEPGVDSLDLWRRGMRSFASAVPEAVLKISGMALTRPQWTVADVRPILLEAVEIFGPERCMLAGNFPVDGMSTDYATIWSAYDQIFAELSSTERDAIFTETARRVYGLSPR